MVLYEETKKDAFISRINHLFGVELENEKTTLNKKRNVLYVGVPTNNLPVLSYIKNNYRAENHREKNGKMYMWIWV